MIVWSRDQKALKEAIYGIAALLNKDDYEKEKNEIFPYDKWKILCDIELAGIVTDEKYGGSGKIHWSTRDNRAKCGIGYIFDGNNRCLKWR